MSLQFGLTPELTNTQFAPVAALSAHYEAQNVLRPLQSVTSEVKQSDFTLANKLTQVILSILTGCEFVSVVNTKLCPEQKLAQLYRIDRFADQSTLSRALNGLTQMNMVELNTAVQQTCHRCSRTLRHDWRGFLLLDFDLSGLPCGKQAKGGSKVAPFGTAHTQLRSTKGAYPADRPDTQSVVGFPLSRFGRLPFCTVGPQTDCPRLAGNPRKAVP